MTKKQFKELLGLNTKEDTITIFIFTLIMMIIISPMVYKLFLTWTTPTDTIEWIIKFRAIILSFVLLLFFIVMIYFISDGYDKFNTGMLKCTIASYLIGIFITISISDVYNYSGVMSNFTLLISALFFVSDGKCDMYCLEHDIGIEDRKDREDFRKKVKVIIIGNMITVILNEVAVIMLFAKASPFFAKALMPNFTLGIYFCLALIMIGISFYVYHFKSVKNIKAIKILIAKAKSKELSQAKNNINAKLDDDRINELQNKLLSLLSDNNKLKVKVNDICNTTKQLQANNKKLKDKLKDYTK